LCETQHLTQNLMRILALTNRSTNMNLKLPITNKMSYQNEKEKGISHGYTNSERGQRSEQTYETENFALVVKEHVASDEGVFDWNNNITAMSV
ncbi:hypothetical protein A4A49_58848, partial [Nicotiana attenuata]